MSESSACEFFLPERVDPRCARFRHLLEAPPELAPVNDLRGWFEVLRQLPDLELSPADAESLVATMAANYRGVPRTALARAVTAITVLAVMDRYGVAVDAIPLDVTSGPGNCIERAARMVEQSTTDLARNPRLACVQLFWILRAAALHDGLLSRLRGSSVAEVREGISVILGEAASELRETRLAQALTQWCDVPGVRGPALGGAVRRWERWSAADRLRHAFSGDTRSLRWRGTARLITAVVAVVVATVGLWWGLKSRAATRQFQEAHAAASLQRLLNE